MPTPAEKGFKASFGQVEKASISLLKQAGGKGRILGVGICMPGLLNPRTGRVINPGSPPT